MLPDLKIRAPQLLAAFIHVARKATANFLPPELSVPQVGIPVDGVAVTVIAPPPIVQVANGDSRKLIGPRTAFVKRPVLADSTALKGSQYCETRKRPERNAILSGEIVTCLAD